MPGIYTYYKKYLDSKLVYNFNDSKFPDIMGTTELKNTPRSKCNTQYLNFLQKPEDCSDEELKYCPDYIKDKALISMTKNPSKDILDLEDE